MFFLFPVAIALYLPEYRWSVLPEPNLSFEGAAHSLTDGYPTQQRSKRKVVPIHEFVVTGRGRYRGKQRAIDHDVAVPIVQASIAAVRPAIFGSA